MGFDLPQFLLRYIADGQQANRLFPGLYGEAHGHENKTCKYGTNVLFQLHCYTTSGIRADVKNDKALSIREGPDEIKHRGHPPPSGSIGLDAPDPGCRPPGAPRPALREGGCS